MLLLILSRFTYPAGTPFGLFKIKKNGQSVSTLARQTARPDGGRGRLRDRSAN